jgi:serine/threonine protein kinase
MTRVSDAALTHLRAMGSDAPPDMGRYTLLDVVGEGGMGTVYRASDTELDREVAVKVLRGVGTAARLDQFRAEARVIASLEHPGIVPVHDAGILPDGRAFYVMTLVRGHRLDDHLGTVAERSDRLRLFLRILEPVAFAHSRGVIHRDLKPSNIMVGPFGEVLVMDWGLAQAPGAVPEPGIAAGTRGFMAPEQAEGSGSLDARADVYALGALLETMIGRDGVPGPLRAIAARAMASRPADRYDSVAALAADVTSFLSGEPVTAYRESVWERLVRLARRYRTPLLLVVAYLVMRMVMLVASSQ